MTQHTPPVYVIGVDFGTLSGRAVVAASAVNDELFAEYTHEGLHGAGAA